MYGSGWLQGKLLFVHGDAIRTIGRKEGPAAAGPRGTQRVQYLERAAARVPMSLSVGGGAVQHTQRDILIVSPGQVERPKASTGMRSVKQW